MKNSLCLKSAVRATHPADTVWQSPWRSSGKQAWWWAGARLLWNCWRGRWRTGNLCVWRCNREGTHRRTAPLRHLSSAAALLQTDGVLAHQISNRFERNTETDPYTLAGLKSQHWHTTNPVLPTHLKLKMKYIFNHLDLIYLTWGTYLLGAWGLFRICCYVLCEAGLAGISVSMVLHWWQ